MSATAQERVQVPEAFAQALTQLGLAGAGPLFGAPLAGGVSSDIWRIDTARGPVCAKRALPKLRVAADWRAPIERNLFEARWLRVANQALPGCAPQVIGQVETSGVLVMEYLPAQNHRLWKDELHAGHADVPTARAVARMLGAIHRYSSAHRELAAQFPTDAIFFDIRLEPYLLATAARHPDLSEALTQLVTATQAHKVALVHGDVSPKNIVIGPQGPMLLDAECAWWGDPAFDLAFCLNHLLLKCLWNPGATQRFAECFDALTDTYVADIAWEPPSELEQRAAHLLPGLLLARVDGKSPVEYITDDAQRDLVRRVARSLMLHPVDRLARVRTAWRKALAR